MKKYIRTKDGRIAEIKDNMFVKQSDVLRLVYKDKPYICVLNGDDEIIKQADNIEELCEEFVMVNNSCFTKPQIIDFIDLDMYKGETIYGATWCDEGLIYVAKINDKGELELIIK